jgi:putative transcriptional regulator
MARFARRERIADKNLMEAIERAERGLIDVELGGGLIKSRVARAGQGRSGGIFPRLREKRTRQRRSGRIVDGAAGGGGSAFRGRASDRASPRAGDEIQGDSLMAARKLSRLTEALLEAADGMPRVGAMDAATHEKITLRHLGERPVGSAEPITGEEIRALREQAHLSQAAFARYLNLTVGYVSQLERGTKQPKGPALALLNVMRRKGVGVIL